MGPLAHQTTGPLISWSVGPWVHWSVAHWVLRCRIAKFSNFLSFADSLQTEGISCQNICAYVTVHIGLKKNLQTSFLGSRVLPCFHSLQFTIMQSRATGIADHLLPLGDLFSLSLSNSILTLGGESPPRPLLGLTCLKLKELKKLFFVSFPNQRQLSSRQFEN